MLIILFLCIVISSSVVYGYSLKSGYICTETDKSSGTRLLNFSLVNSINFSSDGYQHLKVFVSDCRGSKVPEIIAATNRDLQIFSQGGEVLVKRKLDHFCFIPAFMKDMDRDGKSDIVFGTEGAVRNEIVVINGMGNIVSQFREKEAFQEFSGFYPIAVDNGRLFVIVRPDNVESARGILCLDSYNLREQYMFFTPDPVGILFTKNFMIPSYRIHSNGLFLKYGNKSGGISSENFESNGMLLEVGINGERHQEQIIIGNHEEAAGVMDYRAIPGSRNILLYHYSADKQSTEPYYQIFVLNSDNGKIVNKSARYSSTIQNFAVIPYKKDFLSVIIDFDEGMFNISILDKYLKQKKIFRFKEKPVLIATRPSLFVSDYYCYFILADGLYGLNKKLVLDRLLMQSGYTSCVFYSFSGEQYSVLRGKGSLDIYSVM